jgi:hypothetical protein
MFAPFEAPKDQPIVSSRNTHKYLREDSMHITSLTAGGLRSVIRLAVFWLCARLLFGLAWAQTPPVVVVERGDNTCATAQNLGGLPAVASFTSDLAAGDIDFYRFTGTPGDQFEVQLNTTAEPFLYIRNLAWFDGACNLVQGTGPVYYGAPIIRVTVPADGIVVLAVTGDPDPAYNGTHENSGTYDLTGLTVPIRPNAISGRIVDAQTGAGLPGTQTPFASVILEQCFWYGCYGQESTATDEQGGFRFDGIYAGEFRVRVATQALTYIQPIYFPADGAAVTVLSGQNVDLGVIPLEPFVGVASISGLVVDAVTNKALPGNLEPYTYVKLMIKNYWGGYDYVADTYPDENGHYAFFHADSGLFYPGDYQVSAHARQYQTVSNWVDVPGVMAGEVRVAQPVRITSNPVRFYDVAPCSDLSDSQRTCSFSFTMVNGTAEAMHGAMWTLVTGYDTGGFELETTFQVCREGVVLPAATKKKGGRKTAECHFSVPPNVPLGATYCIKTRFGTRPGDPYHTVQGVADLFCMQMVPERGIILPARQSVEIERARNARGWPRGHR